MAYTRNLYPTLNFVLTQCTGIIDDHALLIHLMSFKAESKKLKCIRELVDMRYPIKANKLTVLGLIRIAETHRNLFPKRDFLAAILVNSETMGKMASVYSLLVSTLDLRVKVFQGDIIEPLAWLGYDHADMGKLKRFVGKHANELK